MKKNNIADALRALTIPSLESETADDSSIVTGDGDQTQSVELKAVDETPADSKGAPGEDDDIKVTTVEVGERSDLESAETTSTDSPVSVAALAGETTVSTEALSPRARAIIKQFTMSADGANAYLGHKAESLANKIAKLEEEIEQAKAAKAQAKAAKVVSTESIEVEFDEVSMEGFKGAAEGYKAGIKAFWTKDGKLSFPSMKRYWDWMEEIQKDVDAKSAKVKELKAQLKAELKVSNESADDAGDSSIVTGDGDQTTKVKLEDAQTDQQEVEGEDKPGTAKTVEVDNGPKEEAATTESKDSEVITSGDEVFVSQEGFTGAVKGFAIGTAGVVLAPLTFGLSNGAVDAGLKSKRQQLGNEINALAKRIAQVKNDDLKKAREEGVTIPRSEVEKYEAGDIVKSFLLGMIVPFYSTYQGHQIEELEIELAAKVAALKIEMARKGIATESVDDAADAAAAFAAGAAGAAEAAAAASGDTAAEAAPEVVAEAGIEVGAAEAAEDTAEVAAAVAEEQADAVDAAADVGGEVEASEIGETIEEDSAISEGVEEMAELEDSIEAGEEHVEKYENAEATLESLANAIESAQSTGGMTQQSAAFFNVGFESVGVYLTGKPFVNARGESPIPSLESYGVTDRRDRSTNVSMESVQEWLKKVWEVLKKTFAQIKEWLVKFFQAIFSQAERYKQRATKYKAAAAKVNSSSQGKSKTINVSAATAGKIHIGGDISRWDMHDLQELTKVAGARNAEGSRALIQMRQHVRNILAEYLKGDNANLDELMAAKLGAGDIQTSGELRNAAFSEAYSGDNQEGYKTKVLPGGVELAIIDPVKSQSEGAFRVLWSVLKGWRVVEIKQDAQVKTEVATPTGPQIAKICGDVLTTIGTIETAKAEFKAEALDLVELPAGQDVPEAQAKAVRQFASAYGKIVHAQTSGTSKLFKYVIGTCGAYLDFAAVALKEHGVNVTVAGQAGEAAANAGQAVKDGAGKVADAAKNAVKGSEAAAA